MMKNYIDEWNSNYFNQTKYHASFTYGEVFFYTNRYFLKGKPPQENANVLELGPGTGNNLTYFAGLGMDVYGVEGSETAANLAREKLKYFENIQSQIIVDNYCESPLPFDDNSIDLILDRASLTHNTSANIQTALSECHRILKPGGMMFSIHFFSDSHSCFGRGTRIEDHTFKDIGVKQFEGAPMVHFTNETEIKLLYKRFHFEYVIESTSRIFSPELKEAYSSSSFDIVASKGKLPIAVDS